jgi:hypothetical protein
MAYEGPSELAIDYHPCRYAQSKVLFRGPQRKIRPGHIAFIGGTETYGKYVEEPFTDVVEQSLGKPCINLGTMNAGIDVFLGESAVMDVCQSADTVVVQTLGAHNMSNRFYSVHKRRNDRFLMASVLLKAVYRDVDFTEYSFTRHMLSALNQASHDRFSTVEAELKTAWLARMELLLSKIDCRKVLLHVTSDQTDAGVLNGFGPDPLFVDMEMVEKLEPCVDEIVTVNISDDAFKCTNGMIFPEFEEQAAARIIGPDVHNSIAEQLLPVLQK